MSNFATVKAELVQMLDDLEGASQPLNVVFDYFEPKPDKYPCGMIRTWGGTTKERLDSANDWLTMRFIIRVLVREDNTSDTENLLDEILDLFVAKLNTASIVDTLNGTVEKFDVEDIVPLEIPDMNAPSVGFDILVSASRIQAIT